MERARAKDKSVYELCREFGISQPRFTRESRMVGIGDLIDGTRIGKEVMPVVYEFAKKLKNTTENSRQKRDTSPRL